MPQPWNLTKFRNVTPVIQTVDAYEHNHKLGIAFEARVDKGSLFVLNVDIDKDAATRPAMRQLLYSVRKYVASDAFRPAVSIQPYQLDALFDNTVKQDKGTSENAAVKQFSINNNKIHFSFAAVICSVRNR